MSLLGAEASIIHIGGAITIRSNLRGADLAFIAAGAAGDRLLVYGRKRRNKNAAGP